MSGQGQTQTEDSHVLENGLIAMVNKLHHDAKSTPSFVAFIKGEHAFTLQPLSILRASWKLMVALETGVTQFNFAAHKTETLADV